jgi:hypothetical protein
LIGGAAGFVPQRRWCIGDASQRTQRSNHSSVKTSAACARNPNRANWEKHPYFGAPKSNFGRSANKSIGAKKGFTVRWPRSTRYRARTVCRRITGAVCLALCPMELSWEIEVTSFILDLLLKFGSPILKLITRIKIGDHPNHFSSIFAKRLYLIR